jgi:hypothetical protein
VAVVKRGRTGHHYVDEELKKTLFKKLKIKKNRKK